MAKGLSGLLIDQLEKFYTKNRQDLFTYALSLTGDSMMAEDVIHTVFVKIMERKELLSFAA